MIQGLISGVVIVVLLFAGNGLVALGYGKDGMAAREKLGKTSGKLAFAFGILAFVWLFFGFFFYFAFPNSADAVLSLVTIIVCPVIYAVWFMYARKKAAELIEESKKIKNAQ